MALDRPVGLCARIALSLIFFWAGFLKVIDPIGFMAVIPVYGLPISDRMMTFIVTSFPWWEIVLSIALWVPWVSGAAAWGAMMTSVLFLALNFHAWNLGHGSSCACFIGFDASTHLGPWFPTVRALLLLVLAGYLGEVKTKITAIFQRR